MNETQHAELRELLGAYVLKAVDDVEFRRISKHLAGCPECAREVSLLQGPAAELAWLPAPQEAGALVERISSDLPWRPRRALTRLSAAVAAVAVIAAGFLGTSLVRERNAQDELVSVLALSDRTVPLRPQPGFAGKGKLYVADEGRVALVLEELPDPGDGRSYQLWAVQGSKPSSMAVLDTQERIVEVMDWTGDADVFAVTIEPAGGSPVPTSDPVLASA